MLVDHLILPDLKKWGKSNGDNLDSMKEFPYRIYIFYA